MAFGVLGTGAPQGADIGGWLAAAALAAAALLAAYVTLLRADLTMVPLVIGTMTVFGILAQNIPEPFPGALVASIGGAILIGVLAWWWFRALRRSRDRVGSEVQGFAVQGFRFRSSRVPRFLRTCEPWNLRTSELLNLNS